MIRRPAAAVLLAAACAAAIVACGGPATARERLDTGEALAIGGASAGLLLLGTRIQHALDDRPPRWTEPPAFDRWAAEHIAPPATHERRNFMQSERAAAVNVIVNGILVGTVDGGWPSGEGVDHMAEGQLLYWSGLAALSGVQSAVKGVAGRQRPMARLAPDVAARRDDVPSGHFRRSFWSGHTSSAFFASTFLNLRLRDAMRRELSADAFDTWSWAPSTLLYSWAGWVGWSRIHAQEHWLSDVVVGAVAGWATAELFASFAPGDGNAASAGKAAPLLSVSFRF